MWCQQQILNRTPNEDVIDIRITINEVMKIAGDRNAWRSTVLNLDCQRAKIVILAEAYSQVNSSP